MTLVSKLMLFVARRIPFGYWRLIRFAAVRDKTLWDYPLDLKLCDGLKLRADLRESVYTGVFRDGLIPHQRGFDELCKRLLRKGDIVFDVGANVGYTTMLFSSLVGDGLVVSLEPVPRSYSLLQRSCGDGVLPNVKCLNVAASSSDGEITIFVTDMLDRASAIDGGESEAVVVKSITLDTLMSEYGLPQFVKIDVEGFEADVIAGMQDILAQTKSPIIIFEALNDSCLLQSVALIEKNEANQYSLYRIDNSGELLSVDSKQGSSDYLALPNWAASRLM